MSQQKLGVGWKQVFPRNRNPSLRTKQPMSRMKRPTLASVLPTFRCCIDCKVALFSRHFTPEARWDSVLILAVKNWYLTTGVSECRQPDRITRTAMFSAAVPSMKV